MPWEGLGNRLKRAMAHYFVTTGREFTPAQLAKAVDRSEGTISLWINGQSYPSIEQAYTLARALSVSASWLVYEEGVMLAGYHPPAKPMPPDRLERVESKKRGAR
jgi:transcriptional regulator with XRE-family HTH domain